MTPSPAGPAMDNSSEYPSLSSPELRADLETARGLIVGMGEACADVRAARDATLRREKCLILLDNVGTYARIELDLDHGNGEARKLKAVVAELRSGLETASQALRAFLRLADAKTIESFLEQPDMGPYRFWAEQLRQGSGEALPLAEERLAASLSTYGAASWTEFHRSIPARLRYEVRLGGEARPASASEWRSMRMSPDRRLRLAAMDAGERAWREHEDSCVAALNSIVGQRLELRRLRSGRSKADFLAEPLRIAGIRKAALDAMFAQVRDFRARARGVRLLQARAHGESSVHPRAVVDLPPETGSGADISFSRAIELVEKGFASVHPEMGAFVRLMADRRWIDGRQGERRARGNYCWLFMKSRNPRVFYDPSGTVYDINGLAHEMGHAFGLWHFGGKGLPFADWSGCAAVAETPSIFAELAVRDAMFSSMPDPADRLRTAWLDMLTVVVDLLHNPALFELELAVHELREKGPLTASLIREAEAGIWEDWHGDILSGKSETFWMDEISYDADECFWPFTYIFGSLLAVGILAQRDRLGDGFYRAYVDFLADFGRMNVEGLVNKHFGADLSRPEFWRASLGMVEARIRRFEEVIPRAVLS